MVLFRIGDRVDLDTGGVLIHVNVIGAGHFAEVHSFVSTVPEQTGGHILVAGKINKHVNQQEIANLETEIMTVVKEESVRLEVDNPTASILSNIDCKERHLIVMEHLQAVSLENLYEDRMVTCEEVFSAAKQILTLTSNLHQLGYVHSDLKCQNILLNFGNEEEKNNYICLLLEAALDSQTMDPQSRTQLMQLQDDLIQQGAESLMPSNEDMGQLKLKLGDLGLSCPVNAVPRYTPGTWNYISPEGLLGGRCTISVDMYAASLCIAELALGAPLLVVSGHNDITITGSLLAQMEAIRGKFSQRFLSTTLKKDDYFNNSGMLLSRLCPPGTVRLRQKLQDTLGSGEYAWQINEINLLHKILQKGLAHDPNTRGDAASLISMIP